MGRLPCRGQRQPALRADTDQDRLLVPLSPKESGTSRSPNGPDLHRSGPTLLGLPCRSQRALALTNRRSGRSVVVRINDRGPFVRGRIIDLTPAAAHVLGFSGLAPVTLDVIDRRG
jgi:hypothetical protein